MFHARQVAAAVDHGQDINVVGLVQVQYPVALEDQLPDIVTVFGFRHFPSQFREIFQRFRRLKDAFDKLPGIIRGSPWRYTPESLPYPPVPVPSI
jgi:hypothetical protein